MEEEWERRMARWQDGKMARWQDGKSATDWLQDKSQKEDTDSR